MSAVRVLRRVAVLLVAAGFACAAAPAAGDEGARIARGVYVGDVVLTGLSSERARQALREALARPVELSTRGRTWQVGAGQFLSAADVDDVVRAALRAAPGTKVAVPVAVDEEAVRDYVSRLAPHHGREARDAELVALDDELRPVYKRAAFGLRVHRVALEQALVEALETGRREPIAVPFVRVKPKVTVRDLPRAIVIRRETKTLTLFEGREVVREFRIATGSPSYPTPLGRYEIIDKQVNPWWYPPPSDWARGLSPVPPGPGNPLGTRWMGISAPSVGIHGTPSPSSIGYSASHGCVRMYIHEAEWLFERVELGSPVFVVSA